MDSSIKSLTITGVAAEDAVRSRQPVKSRKKREIIKEDDEFIENAKKFVSPVRPEKPIHFPQIHAQNVTHTQHAPRAPHVEQEKVESSVILKPPKQLRVKLQPKVLQPTVKPVEPGATRKARRIRLHVANLNHRFTRAKRVKDDTEMKSISTIREFLVNRGVIQDKSKAPDKMLRSMYSDFMLLKDQAL
jgi:hypothetical protein